MSRLAASLMVLCLAFGLGCATTAPDASSPARPMPSAPAGAAGAAGEGAIPWADSLTIEANGPYPVNLADLEPAGVSTDVVMPRSDEIISDEEADRRRREALDLAPDLDIQTLTEGTTNLVPGINWDSLGSEDSSSTPPDPELAVGPGAVVAVVNVAFEIYDKAGNTLVGPTSFNSFFAGVPGCGGTFDPNALYDEKEDRYILGVDANGSNYCIAVSANPGDVLNWNRYSFATNVGGAFFDYPHAGVQHNVIIMGSNQFAGGFLEGRVWAMNKLAMYAGGALTTVTRSTGNDSTPMPAHFHGASDGTFPTSGPNWFMTEVFDNCNHTVWTWNDPLGANNLVRGANLNLCAATGVAAGFPINVPQLGGSPVQANDVRGQSTEFRNGKLWMTTQGISCNPGGGVVDCVRWAQIDPVANTVLDAGVFATNNQWRFFPNLAVNVCDDMVVGYSKSNAASFISTWVAGRESGDPPGTLQQEIELKAGNETYNCFDAPPHRWGDYTKTAIDPDGVTFWYLGEYSKGVAGDSCDWGNYIGSFTFPDCVAVEIFADGFESGDTSAWSGSVP